MGGVESHPGQSLTDTELPLGARSLVLGATLSLMNDGSPRRSPAEDPFPVARQVSPTNLKSRREQQSVGFQWSPFVWISVGVGVLFAAFVLLIILFAPQ